MKSLSEPLQPIRSWVSHDLIDDTSDGLNEPSDCESTPSPCDLCAGATQHTCRNCGIPVSNLMCSIQDTNSENESNRIHKYGDERCVRKHADESLAFICPQYERSFKDITTLNEHIKNNHTEFEQSFPSVSIPSDGSISDVYPTCPQCDKVFHNELDMKNHIEKVHKYGEMFLLYPCEECGFRGGDMRELASHMDQGHKSETECCKESLGISQRPVYTKRKKQSGHLGHGLSNLDV